MTFGFVTDTYSVAESTGEVTLIFELIDGQLERVVSLDFAISDGTATSVAPIDFIDPGPHTLRFDNSTTRAEVHITIKDDDILESNENFFGNLATLDDTAVILNPGHIEIIIVEDNDGKSM